MNVYKYDHFTFPGAVPRTFVGSVLIAWIAAPVIQLVTWLGLSTSKFDLQIISERFLGESLAACRLILKHSSSRIGKPECLDLVPCEESHNETF